jgi:hypothetical protein
MTDPDKRRQAELLYRAYEVAALSSQAPSFERLTNREREGWMAVAEEADRIWNAAEEADRIWNAW